jgi:hypothetical protein
MSEMPPWMVYPCALANISANSIKETLIKQFKWFHELEEIMGDRPNVGRPLCPVDSLGSPSHRDKGKQKERQATDDVDLELNEEEREELRIEEERLKEDERLKRLGNQPSPAEEEDEMGVPGSANVPPAARSPSADDDVEPTKRGRKQNLRKLAKKAKGRGTTKQENTAVEAANEKMDALVKANERIQKEKLQIEERMETKRIESRETREKEERDLQHKNIQAVGGIIKDIVHDVTLIFQPGVQPRGNAAPPTTFPSTSTAAPPSTAPPPPSTAPPLPSTSPPPPLRAPTPAPFSFRTSTAESMTDLNAASHTRR